MIVGDGEAHRRRSGSEAALVEISDDRGHPRRAWASTGCAEGRERTRAAAPTCSPSPGPLCSGLD